MTNNNDWQKVEFETWNGKDSNLQEGDELVGIYQDKEEDVGENHSTVYMFKTERGSVSVWGSTVLDARLKNLEIGENVKIVYLGKKKSEKRKGKEYHNYDVYHRNPTVEDIPVIEEGDAKSFEE